MEINKPLVSVNITTYNHEKYIEQAVNSVLNQKTDFPFEIIIGEDESSDNTRQICLALQKKYPSIIKVLLNSRKDVIYIDGVPTGRYNFLNNLKNSSGKYVALLDGDDYWTNPLKLAKQLAFLENNPDCSFCFHDLILVDEAGNDLKIEKLPRAMKKTLQEEELIAGYFPTPPMGSLMFHRNNLLHFPDWFNTFRNGDLAISIILASKGNAGYIDEKMTAYRQHAGGVWSSKNIIYRAKGIVKMRKMLIELYAPIGLEENSQKIIDTYLLILKESIMILNLKSFFIHTWKVFTFLGAQKLRWSYFFKRILNKYLDTFISGF